MFINNLKYKLSNNISRVVLLVIVLSAISYNHAFSFHLYWDDWFQILGSLYYPEILNSYLTKHPVSILEFKLFSGIFKYNPYFWEFLGYLLKIIAALSLWPLMFILTNSKKVALYSCLFFAVSVVGAESYYWASAHSSTIVIPLINLGFYFWIKSADNKSFKIFFIGLLLFTLSILAEPGRAFMTIVLASIWEFFSLYQNIKLKNLIFSLIRLTLLFSLIPLTGLILNKFFHITPDISILIREFSEISINNIIDSLKNLLFGWTLIPEQLRIFLTIVFLLSMVLTSILFFWKKHSSYKIILFLDLWLLLFYIPNYLAQTDARLGGSTEHRYYTISAVALIGLMAYGFSFLNSKYINWIIVLFLVFNVYVTNQVLLKNSTYRSIQIHNKIWSKIDQDVPPGEKNSIFMFSGVDSNLRSRLLDWNDTMPFVAKRGLVISYEYPFFTNDKFLIAKLICEKNTIRHGPLGDIIQKESIPLSKVHAWELKNGELENRSEQERNGIKAIAKCLPSK